jgi:phosphoglycerate dehydrogenase-like enzyme
VHRIEAVSPAVRVRVLGRGQREAFVAAFGRAPYPSEIQARTPPGAVEEALPNAEVAFAFWGAALAGIEDLPRFAPRLRWVQLTHVGAEGIAARLLASDIMFTSAVGLASTPIAELVLAYMLMFTKGWPGLSRRQQAHEYARLIPGTLDGKTVGIIGMGSIGNEIARLARPFGCRVIGMRRSATERSLDTATDVEVVPPAGLHYLLGASNFVVLAAPLTPETRGFIDSSALTAMRPEAVLINIARGELIDGSALVDALQQRRIRGAALDVFAEEPLPPDSPLWDLDNVILTPHIAGGFDRYFEVGTAMFCANLERYLRGQPLQNLIEAPRGY